MMGRVEDPVKGFIGNLLLLLLFCFVFLFCSTAKANQITQTQCESCVLNTCIHWDLNVFLPTDNKLIVPYTR